MTLKISVGLSKKLGQPHYGSLGASCHIEVELDQALLFYDLDGLHQKIKQAYAVCRQAIHVELHPPQPATIDPAPGEPAAASSNGNHGGPSPTGGNGQADGHAVNPADSGLPEPIRMATANQVRALEAIARRSRIDLPDFVEQRFGVLHPSELTLSEASQLIDDLKESATVSGGRRS